MRNLPCPHTTSLLAVSATLSPRWNAFRRGTLSPELRTRSLPIAHVRVGNYWSYSRSQLQHPILRTLNVTRQERALPSTTVPIYVRQTATRVAPTSRLYRSVPFTVSPCGSCVFKLHQIPIGRFAHQRSHNRSEMLWPQSDTSAVFPGPALGIRLRTRERCGFDSAPDHGARLPSRCTFLLTGAQYTAQTEGSEAARPGQRSSATTQIAVS